jgi:transcriptional regulator NrdR family protein
MDCPHCKKKTYTVDTRVLGSGEVKRRRVCYECKNKFSTLECLCIFNRTDDPKLKTKANIEQKASMDNKMLKRGFEEQRIHYVTSSDFWRLDNEDLLNWKDGKAHPYMIIDGVKHQVRIRG